MTKYDIYLIWGKDHDGNILRYYGSTSNFIKRKYNHKKTYEYWVKAGRPNNKHKCSSVYILDNGDWRMDKIDEIDGERWEARKKEGEYIKNNDCVNFQIASRTDKEYRDDNKQKIAERYKQYRIDNKDKIAEYKKQWQTNNKEWNKKYRTDNKDKLLEYRKEWGKINKDKMAEYGKEWANINKDKIAEYKKKWANINKDKIAEKQREFYNNNKQALLEKSKEKIICECGSKIRKGDLAKHRKTKKHINLLSNNELNV